MTNSTELHAVAKAQAQSMQAMNGSVQPVTAPEINTIDMAALFNSPVYTQPGEGTFQMKLVSFKPAPFGVTILCKDVNTDKMHKMDIRVNGYAEVFQNIMSHLCEQLGATTIRDLFDPNMVGKEFVVTGYNKEKDDKTFINYSFRI